MQDAIKTNLSDYDYELPRELIAQYPLERRDASRLLVHNRREASVCHRHFSDIADYLEKGDLLILNNTKVVMARLFARRPATGGKVEIFLLEQVHKRRFRALLKPMRRLKIGEELIIDNDHGLSCRLVDAGNKVVEFSHDDVFKRLQECGHVPLPQYIKRSDEFLDRERYQTVYAKKEGAVAAPTAGLHFTRTLMGALKRKGVKIAFVTLHVGYGTFSPIRQESIAGHAMEEEYFEIPAPAISLVRRAKENKKRVIAVGTTVCRALESNKDALLTGAAARQAIKGRTALFIRPPFTFSVVDALITNFHLPKSTLFILVAAFAGLDQLKKAYQCAVAHRYRFFSYGDAMFIA